MRHACVACVCPCMCVIAALTTDRGVVRAGLVLPKLHAVVIGTQYTGVTTSLEQLFGFVDTNLQEAGAWTECLADTGYTDGVRIGCGWGVCD